MCGISGFFLPGSGLARSAAEARLWTMIATLRHRGPDDEGVWTDGRAGLAHARLSIIDLSPAAHQPMPSADRTVWISYNGEVYNFREIRSELETLGYRFVSRSDSEVIVNGWHAWGPTIFSRLRGMFALAIWDQRSQRLILARDRLGKKPLYFTTMKNALLFGSEIKALLTWPGVPRIPDLSAIDRYLSLGYVPAPDTAFRGIRKLPAAHYLVAERCPDGRFAEPELIRYWRLPEQHATAGHWRAADLRHELVARLEEAVRLRMISDVPLGVFLSGGVDSSAVVATMARVGCGSVKTFSIGFSARQYDETRYARMVAERYATDHEEFVIEPDAVSVLPRLVWHYGEPFADPSAVPTYYVSEVARREVTVALNGDGGDECFLGYSRYKAMRYLARLDKLPRWTETGLERALALAPPNLRERLKISRIRRVLQARRQEPARRYSLTLASFTEGEQQECYGGAMREQPARSALGLFAPYFEEADSFVDAANRADIHTYLPDDLMVKVDAASMAHGLEARSPLLDHVLMEWAATLPVEIKMARGVTKALFKSAMEPYLPAQLLYRKKMGFSCPVDQWFREELKELAHDTLLSQRARERGLFRPGFVCDLLDEHCSGTRDHQTSLWRLLMLELWFQMWIDTPVETAITRPAS
ncbi:MAG: asparagine synthase (glutamine-hydrolyzing) [Alphaproteobacteria bacterium]|nr:asparagine synthase (glutamine-hydrolyzing) [Alphaproteobacteria bacterium]